MVSRIWRRARRQKELGGILRVAASPDFLSLLSTPGLHSILVPFISVIHHSCLIRVVESVDFHAGKTRRPEDQAHTSGVWGRRGSSGECYSGGGGPLVRLPGWDRGETRFPLSGISRVLSRTLSKAGLCCIRAFASQPTLNPPNTGRKSTFCYCQLTCTRPHQTYRFPPLLAPPQPAGSL
jgi:hypothetical protein